MGRVVRREYVNVMIGGGKASRGKEWRLERGRCRVFMRRVAIVIRREMADGPLLSHVNW
jgi:hypothetical protein